MKEIVIKLFVLVFFIGLTGASVVTDPSTWTKKQVDEWFEKGEWANGWKTKPDGSINRKEFAIAYFKNKERWDKAFEFLKNSDLTTLAPKRYNIDGDNLYATISEYQSKNETDVKFETHKKYIDIQYVISGTELMSLAPMADKKDVTTPYDGNRDIEYMTVSKFSGYPATSANFFLFFPSDIHRPSVKVAESVPVRKVVIKVKID